MTAVNYFRKKLQLLTGFLIVGQGSEYLSATFLKFFLFQ